MIGGEEVVNKHFSLDRSKHSLLNDKTENLRSDNYIKIKNTLENLADKSLIQQEQRMDLEEESGPLSNKQLCSTVASDETAEKLIKQSQAKLQRELKGLSNKKCGFLMWLDYNRSVNQPSVSLINPTPFHPQNTIEKMLSQTTAAAAIENEINENDVGNNGNDEAVVVPPNDLRKKPPSKNVLLSGATDIATTAKYVLQDVKSGKIAVRDPVGVSLDLTWFSSALITNIEKQYYEDRNTTLKVLQLLGDQYNSSAKWELFPLIVLNEVDKARIEDIRRKHQIQIENASKISTSFLVPHGHNINSNQEILEYGVGATALTNAKSKHHAIPKHVMSAEERKRKLAEAQAGLDPTKCRFFNCSNDLSSSVHCVECGEYFCALHFEHNIHRSIILCSNSADCDDDINNGNKNNTTNKNKKRTTTFATTTAAASSTTTTASATVINNKTEKQIKKLKKQCNKKVQLTSFVENMLISTSSSSDKEMSCNEEFSFENKTKANNTSTTDKSLISESKKIKQ